MRLELAVRFSVSSSSTLPRSKFRVVSHADAYLHRARTQLARQRKQSLVASEAEGHAQSFDLQRPRRHVRSKRAAQR